MSKKFLTNIDLGTTSRVIALAPDASGTDPTGTIKSGQIFYNTGAGALKYYNGAAWITLAAGTGAFDPAGSAATASGLANSYTNSQISALSSVYQPLDGDLTAISSLSGTGILTRTGADTWSLDTSSYITSTYADSASQTAYNNAKTYADSASSTAYTNGQTYSNSASGTSYTNAATYARSASNTAYASAISVAASLASTASNAAVTSANTYANSASGTAYNNAVTYADSASGTAYTNAVSSAQTYSNSASTTAYNNAVSTAGTYSNSASTTAYNNATTYANNASTTAYNNAVSTASTYANSASGTAYTNAQTYANSASTTAYNNGKTYADSASGTAYTKASTLVSSSYAPLNDPHFPNNVSVGGNLYVSGSAYISGSTLAISASNLTLTDSLIYLAEDNHSDAIDIGFIGSYDDGTYQHTGLVRDASDGVWKLFHNVTDEPTTVVNFSQAVYSPLKIESLQVTSSALVTNFNADYLDGYSSSYFAPIGSPTFTGTVNLGPNIATGSVGYATAAGNANTVTNGVYTTGSYSNPSWITSLAWSKISSTPTTLSGYGITDATKKYSVDLAGSTTSYTVTHNLGSTDVLVNVYDNSTFETVEVDVVRTTASVVTITFAVAPSSNAYRAVVIG